MELKNEGPTQCFVAVAILDQGKTNQFGRIEYGGCVRARDVEVCPVGALALHLFWRFQIAHEPFPKNNLDRAYGAKWRKAETERKHYSRRNVFYDAI
jgi:hypothetical protein